MTIIIIYYNRIKSNTFFKIFSDFYKKIHKSKILFTFKL
nr:MAG TPA: hypothetical protein [Caudoviricetes sp.]